MFEYSPPQPPPTTEQNGDVTGYFIGYKTYNQTAPYMYLTHSVTSGNDLEVTLTDLDKFTPYAVHVQAFNRQGAGPTSDDVITRTLEDGKCVGLNTFKSVIWWIYVYLWFWVFAL